MSTFLIKTLTLCAILLKYSHYANALHDNFDGLLPNPVIVHPRISPISHRSRREASIDDFAREASNIVIELVGSHLTLELEVNRKIVQSNFQVHHQNDGALNRWEGLEGAPGCHYHGNVRNASESWVAVSTCSGIIRGAIFDGKILLEIRPLLRSNFTMVVDHVIGRPVNKREFLCGVNDHVSASKETAYRNKREDVMSQNRDRGQLHYVELVVVADQSLFKKYDNNMGLITLHVLDVTNIVHELYQPLGISITLVGLIVWSEEDAIHTEKNIGDMLSKFGKYRKQHLKENNFDLAYLLTGKDIQHGTIGKAYVDSVCDNSADVGVVVDLDSVVATASTVTHEIGHNFGLRHDDESCGCEDCIMGSSAQSAHPARQWSRCSQDNITKNKSKYYCLMNSPKKCGNMVVDEGEECDCGLPAYCRMQCCDPYTCKLKKDMNIECFSGACCDLVTCRFQTLGAKCRPVQSDCDLPEFCSGESKDCPIDLHKYNGERCDGYKVCQNGICNTKQKERVRAPQCPTNCSGNGVCNNLGRCHCFMGYSPPLCVDVGFGGSEDGGVAFRRDVYFLQGFGYYLAFLAVIPIIVYLLVLWCCDKSDEQRAYLKENIYAFAGNAKSFAIGYVRRISDALRNARVIGIKGIATARVREEQRSTANRKISLTLPNLRTLVDNSSSTRLSDASSPTTPHSTATTITPIQTPQSPESGNMAEDLNNRPLFLPGPKTNHLSIPRVHYTRPAPFVPSRVAPKN